MDRLLYVAMTGASEVMRSQALLANNLANSSTVGFKQDLEQMRAMPVYGDGLPTRVYAMTESPGTDFAAGGLIPTQNDLDVAISGEGFFTVLNGNNEEAYTRAGNFIVDGEGVLRNASGLAVMGTGGAISIPPYKKLEIGTDGTISIIPQNGANETAVVINRLKTVNPDVSELAKGKDGLFYKKDKQSLELDPSVHLHKGHLEGSNVNTVAAITKMIGLARNFEMQVKLMGHAEENDQAAAQLLQIA